MWHIIAYYVFFFFTQKSVNSLVWYRGYIQPLCLFHPVGWVTDYMEYNVTKSLDSNDSDEDMDVTEDENSETRTAREKT